MPTPAELEAKFWKSLKADMTMMIGIDGSKVIPRPMTAQLARLMHDVASERLADVA
ncbi:hypothetical protein HB777_23905 [Mesorhizobium loti]|nr:hypothetical protein HB777_23905 [Mesorhizobium loti]